MSSLDYRERYTRLTIAASLEQQLSALATDDDAFAVDLPTELRARQSHSRVLDILTSEVNRPESQDLRALMIQAEDFDEIGSAGSGQFGKVAIVRCRINGAVYALKKISRSTVARAGIQLSAQLERTIHLLALYDKQSEANVPAPHLIAAFYDDEAIQLVTPYATGGTLGDRLSDALRSHEDSVAALGKHVMPEAEIFCWARQMLIAVEWLHSHGFVHRDVKPHNFLLLPPDHLQLTDFGSAAHLIELSMDGHTGATVKQVLYKHSIVPVGTPDYISPEILLCAERNLSLSTRSIGQSEHPLIETYGARVDYWSLGVTLFELVSGQTPFWRPAVKDTYDAIMECGSGRNHPRLPSRIEWLTRLCDTLLSPITSRVPTSQKLSKEAWRCLDMVDKNTQSTGIQNLPDRRLDPIALLPRGHGSYSEMLDEITFDHFFDTTTDVAKSNVFQSDISVFPAGEVLSHGSAGKTGLWTGWTWLPLPMDLHTVAKTIQDPAPSMNLANSKSTPKNGRSSIRSPATAKGRAMTEMIQCVLASARKRRLGHNAETMTTPRSNSTSTDEDLAADFNRSSWNRHDNSDLAFAKANYAQLRANLQLLTKRLATMKDVTKGCP